MQQKGACLWRSRMLTVAVFFLMRQPLEAQPGPPVTFTHGIASGDVTSSRTVLWTRVDQQASVEVEVATDPTFAGRVSRQTVLASAENDFTAKAIVKGLRSNQTYFYRWRSGSSSSEVGTFKTAPSHRTSANVRFAYSGDSDGTLVSGLPFFNDFETLDAARLEGLDFFLYLGDTIYSDSRLRTTGPATSLGEYRDAYKANRDIAALRNLQASTATYAVWDDHEVQNDFDGETVDPTRYANGRQAFLEYMPLREPTSPRDRSCADIPFFRVFRWGRDVDLIFLDERSCRSADVAAICHNDLAPTLAPFLRQQFAQLGIPLPPNPPAGCREAISDRSRTMLGRAQKRRFMNTLRSSRATFKFVINEVPIQQLYALPYDRWEGYAAEREEILDFIRDERIDNVIFLTADTHANLVNEVFIDTIVDPRPIATEFVTGPIATFTFDQEIRVVAPSLGLDPEIAVNGFNLALDVVGVDCANTNAFSYGLVEVNAGTATITLKDDTGAVLCTKQIR